MKIFFLSLLAALLMAVSFVSCDSSNDCYTPTDVSAGMSFASKNDTSYVDTGRGDSVITDTRITDTVLRFARIKMLYTADSLLFSYNEATPPLIRFIMSPDTGRQSYQIQFDSTSTAVLDTITLFYRSSLQFLSNACGYTFYFNIDSVQNTFNYIDSISITDSEVQNDASLSNIKMYFFNR